MAYLRNELIEISFNGSGLLAPTVVLSPPQSTKIVQRERIARWLSISNPASVHKVEVQVGLVASDIIFSLLNLTVHPAIRNCPQRLRLTSLACVSTRRARLPAAP